MIFKEYWNRLNLCEQEKNDVMLRSTAYNAYMAGKRDTVRAMIKKLFGFNVDRLDFELDDIDKDRV